MTVHHSLPGLMLLAGLCAASVSARDLHYGAVTDPALLECDAINWRGQREQARACYRTLLQSDTDAAIRAEAAWALGDLKAANRLFQQAVYEQPDDANRRTRWGELYRETYQFREALTLFNEALERDPGNAFASVGAARVLVQSFEAQAAEYLVPVLGNDDSPAGARLAALLLFTRMALEDADPKRAAELLAQAQIVAGTARLPQLEIYAMHASLDLLNGIENSDWTATALAENPGYGAIFATPAYYYDITRRYREAVALYQKAVEIQPDLWSAQLELGINLLRVNEITEARKHIERAYGGDPYNPKAVNTLRLLDSFDAFEVIHFPEQVPADGFPRLSLRLHEDERGVLAGYASQLAEQSMAQFSERYRFEPKEPVIIEIYPDHEDFVVRTTGMPGLSILGVTFGYLLAMDSPSGHPEQSYHWGTTLWHEMAHVFTLEATGHLVPRWFSEGISVYEEWQTGPNPGIRLPVAVYQAIADQKFLPIAELDRGFIRPAYAGQVLVSYMQAGLICEFIVAESGFNALVELLEQFGGGADTPGAIQAGLGMAPSEFDKAFGSFVEERFGPLIARLDQWLEAQQASFVAVVESDWPATIKSAKQAIAIYPDYVGSDSPYRALANAYANTDAPAKELEVLETYWQKGGYAPAALKQLAEGLYEAGRREDAVAVLQSLNYVAPFDTDLHVTLGDWLLALDRAQDALAEYEVVLAMAPHDLAAAHYRLAQAHHALDHRQQTRQHLLAALEIAPHYRDAQRLLLETSAGKCCTDESSNE